MAYRIEYCSDVENHLRVLTVRQQAIVLDAVEKHLTYQPRVETKNRKPMRPNPLAPWELRIGNIRVYYDVQEEPTCVVFVRAVGIKRRRQVSIGEQVIEL